MKMKLDYYKSEKGIYVARELINYLNRRDAIYSGSSYLINGKSAIKTHHIAWMLVEGETELKKFERQVTGEKVNTRWELRENTPDLLKNVLPKMISQEDSLEWFDDDDDCYNWCIGEKCEHKEYSSYYNRIQDTAPSYYKEEDIEITYLGEIDSNWVASPKLVRYAIPDGSGRYMKDMTLDVSSVATYSELSQMMVSDLLLHNQPCSLTSLQTYQIIRKYVGDNIDPLYGKITSDYDFCFTVQKKISIKPWVKRTEATKANGRSYAKPRITSRSIESKLEPLFDMTHKGSGGNYRGYAPINGFKGESLQELTDNIKTYLDELMGHINAPLSECQHCDGTGHTNIKSFDKNKR